MTAAPSFGGLLVTSGPRFLRDAFGPTVIFYLGWKLHGLVPGIAAASVWTLVVYRWEKRHGRPGVAARIGLAIALVQAIAGLASRSPVGYFAPPIVVNTIYGLAFLVSVVIGRPLAWVFARELYPGTIDTASRPALRRVFARISVAWGVYMLFRSAVRIVVLLNFSIDVYVLVNVLTATPMTVGLMAWSFWYGLRALRSLARGRG